jgi:hypothetical protein
MKKRIGKKLTLPKETLRELQVPELEEVAGGAAHTYRCNSCGSPLSTCPVVL